MKTLIVAATEMEIAASIPALVENRMDYLVTGVGMLATAFSIGQNLRERQYDLLVNVGIAGSFQAQHTLGSLFKVRKDHVYEFGAENDREFIPIDQMGFGSSIYSERLPERPMSAAFYQLPYIDGITVNKVHGSDEGIRRVFEQHGPNTIESMEGAAFFYAAQKLGLPCIQVRSISNWVEKRNVERWNIPLAIKALNEWLIAFAQEHAQK